MTTRALEQPTSTAAQIASLNALLTTLDRTRSSLPSLLRSFQLPATSPLERATVYRAASNEAWSSIRALGDELQGLEGVLVAAEESERLDPVGIVVKDRVRSGATGWEKLGRILGDDNIGGKGKGREEVYQRTMRAPASAQELVELMTRWEQEHPKIRLQLHGVDGEEQSEIVLVLKGVMRAVMMLRWSEREDGVAGRSVQVERVACFGIKEEVIFFRFYVAMCRSRPNELTFDFARTLRRNRATSSPSSLYFRALRR
jgi:hypothetical protein